MPNRVYKTLLQAAKLTPIGAVKTAPIFFLSLIRKSEKKISTFSEVCGIMIKRNYYLNLHEALQK